MPSNLVKYEEWSPEAAEEEAAAIQSEGDFMKLAVGRTVVRFLPPPLGQKSPFTVVWQHYIKLPGATSAMTFACPRMEQRRHCPACAKADELRATGNPADYDLAGEVMARKRVFGVVIDRANEDAGPRVLPFGKTVHEGLLSIRNDKDAGGNFTDPSEEGFDIIIAREGTGKNDTKYKVSAARSNTPLHEEATTVDVWLESRPDLSRIARVPSDEELERMMGGTPRASGGGRRRTAADDAIDT